MNILSATSEPSGETGPQARGASRFIKPFIITILLLAAAAVIYSRYYPPDPCDLYPDLQCGKYRKPTPTPTPKPVDSVVIHPGESAEVQCGDGSGGVNPQLDSGNSNVKYTSAGGEKRTITVYVLDKDFHRADGARLKWTFGAWTFGGSLEIKECSAVFTPPNSLGSASNSSASIYVTAALPVPSSSPQATGEGGPIFVGYVLKEFILVYR